MVPLGTAWRAATFVPNRSSGDVDWSSQGGLGADEVLIPSCYVTIQAHPQKGYLVDILDSVSTDVACSVTFEQLGCVG